MSCRLLGSLNGGGGGNRLSAVALAVLFVFLYAQASAAYQHWSKRYDEGDDLGTAVAARTGGGVVGVGSTDGDSWMVALDEDGAVDWELTWPVGSSSEFYSVIETPNSNYCAVGTAVISGDREMWAVCVSSGGTEQWQRTYGGDEDDEGFDLIHIDDATYGDMLVMVGYTESFKQTTDKNFWVLGVEETDVNSREGELVQLTIGGISGIDAAAQFGSLTGDEVAYTVVHSDTGEVTVSGYSDYLGPGGDDIWVLQIAYRQLLISWQESYGWEDGDEIAYGSVMDDDDDIVLVGEESGADDEYYGRNLYLLKIDNSDASVVWEVQYRSGENAVEVGYDVYLDSSDRLIVAGECGADTDTLSARDSTDMLLFSADPSDGTLTGGWIKYYDADPTANYPDQGWSVAEDLGDGEILFGGESLITLSDMDWWVLNLNSNGNVASSGTDCTFPDPLIDPVSVEQEGNSTTITAARTSFSPDDPEVSSSSTSLAVETLCEDTP
jgi:hypothetical protein